MSSPESVRAHREPPPPEKLKRRRVGSLRVLKATQADRVAQARIRLSWYRLCPDVYAKTFFPSRNSRFTPASWDFPCAYFAESPPTCFAEKFGDQIAKHVAQGLTTPYIIPAAMAAVTGLYETTDSPEMTLCDLTDETTLLRLGLDLGTLYAPDLGLTQRWAEAIARMDAGFDGIRYQSRHTSKLCQVLWDRPGAEPLSTRILSERKMPLLDAPFAWEVAALAHTRLSFAQEPGS